MASKKKVENQTDKKPEENGEVAESTPLAAGVPDGASKTNALSIVMKSLSGMSNSEIADFFNKSIATMDSKHFTKDVGDKHAKNVASIKTHWNGAVKEDIQTIFGDAELSEEVKGKMVALFEAAVDGRVAFIQAELEEQNEAKIKERAETATETLVQAVEEHLEYVTKKWLEDNAVQVEQSLAVEVAFNFLDSLRNLFLEHGIDVPEDKADLLDVMNQRVEELEKVADEALKENMALKEKISSTKKNELVSQASEGMTQADAERFQKLAEGLEYEGNDEAFSQRLDYLKNTTMKKAPGDSGIVSENTPEGDDDSSEKNKNLTPQMKSIVDRMSALARK